jgi:REP element-mobilizing transposase RayT
MSQTPPSPFDWRQAQLAHRDNLPHVRQDNVVYFVTFRLADSLPAERVQELREERDRWLRLHPEPHTPAQQSEYRRIWTARIENLMDAGYGRCELRDAGCRGMLEACMRHDDETAYRLGPFVIMPNHVHALLLMLPGYSLSDMIKAWKSISARRIGTRLGRRGSYWMNEYFDHAVRGDDSLEKFARYVRENPTRLRPGEFTLGSGTLEVP